MAKKDTLHIRIEPSVKERAEKTLNDLGLSITLPDKYKEDYLVGNYKRFSRMSH